MPQHTDVKLQHTDGSSNPVELTLWKDSPNLPNGYSLGSKPFLPLDNRQMMRTTNRLTLTLL